MVAANAAVEAMLEERWDEDVITRWRGDTGGMRPRLNGHLLLYTYANKVKMLYILRGYLKQRTFL